MNTGILTEILEIAVIMFANILIGMVLWGMVWQSIMLMRQDRIIYLSGSISRREVGTQEDYEAVERCREELNKYNKPWRALLSVFFWEIFLIFQIVQQQRTFNRFLAIEKTLSPQTEI